MPLVSWCPVAPYLTSMEDTNSYPFHAPLAVPLEGCGPPERYAGCWAKQFMGEEEEGGYRDLEEGLWSAPAELRADKSFIYHAIASRRNLHDWPLNCASAELREDRDLLAVSFAMRPLGLQYQAPEVQALACDPDFMIRVVSMHGVALQCASPFLRGNRRVVAAAVACMGGALIYASEALRNDWTIVTIATAQLGTALHLAGQELRQRCGDTAILLEAQRIRDGLPRHLIEYPHHKHKTVAPLAACARSSSSRSSARRSRFSSRK